MGVMVVPYTKRARQRSGHRQLDGRDLLVKSAKRFERDHWNYDTAGAPNPRPNLQAAALGAPIFRESWSAGAPLNWVEFVERARAGRALDRADPGASEER